MIFEAVEVLVAFPAGIAAVWLVLFHAYSTRIGIQSFGIHNGKGAIVVVFELLGIVAMLVAISRGQPRKRAWNPYALVILQAVLVLICLLTSNNGALERLRHATIS